VDDSRHHPIFDRFRCWAGDADGRFHYDFLGVRTDSRFWGNTNVQTPGPLKTAYPRVGEQYFEWVFILESVYAAREAESFSMVELGAGYGPWLLRAHHAFRQFSNKPVGLVGVEGDPDHFRWMKEHFENNGLSLDEHRLFEGGAGLKDGTVAFFVGDDPATEYNQRIHFPKEHVPSDDPQAIYDDARWGRRYRMVPSYSLETVTAHLDRVDLLHMDIQGLESGLVDRAMEVMNRKVVRVIIGTHHETWEEQLRERLGGEGWTAVYDFPGRILNDTPCGPIQFKDGIQAWINPALELSPTGT
jgi:FkbM family methyltransferase